MNSAAEVAKFLLDRLSPKFKLIKKSHRFAGFAVLKALDTPSVLIELGYLSNKKELIIQDPGFLVRTEIILSKNH